jgi:hypothetical protein
MWSWFIKFSSWFALWTDSPLGRFAAVERLRSSAAQALTSDCAAQEGTFQSGQNGTKKCFKSQIIVATCGGLLWNSKQAEVP